MDEKWEVAPDTDLASLVDKVSQGETVDLVRDGHTVARVVPVIGQATYTAKPTMDDLRRFREKVVLGPDLTIKDLVDHGRRY